MVFQIAFDNCYSILATSDQHHPFLSQQNVYLDLKHLIIDTSIQSRLIDKCTNGSHNGWDVNIACFSFDLSGFYMRT